MKTKTQKKKDWKIKKLGDEDIFSVDYGTRVVRKRDGGTKYDVYGGGGKTFFMDIFNRENELVIARFAMSEKCTRFVEGKFFLNDSGLTVGVKNKKQILRKYLNHYFIFLNDYIYSLGRGSAQRNLDIKKLKEIKISFPKSLTEQKRIVKILDEVFENIEKAKENAEKNLENTKELFESYLQGVFENPESDLEVKTLGELFQNKPPKKEAREKLKENDLVSLVPMKDLGILQKSFLKNIKKPLKDVIKGYVYFADEDVLMAKITPSFENGKLGIARNLKNGIGFGSSEFIVFRSKGEVISDYLFYFLTQSYLRKELKPQMTGTSGHRRVPVDILNEYILKYPKSLDKQKQIVKKLDELSEKVGEMEAILRSKIADLDELKKSVLKKAFDGEL